MLTEIIIFIKEYLKENPYVEGQGHCYFLHLALLDEFGGIGYYDSNHIVTRIGDYFFDYTGKYTGSLTGYLPIQSHFGYEHMNETFQNFI